ncbi:hypothetical protein ACFPFV_05700 [Salinicoccus siamensis]|uniref:hypothetical protein n=1 Tax=Salinicoccus siamensis TaxID=381830 RepID=UPI00360A7222
MTRCPFRGWHHKKGLAEYSKAFLSFQHFVASIHPVDDRMIPVTAVIQAPLNP